MLPKQPNQSLIDGIRCLQAVVSHEEPVGVSQLAQELNIESTRVHRFLRTLTHTGLIERNARRKYHAGPALPVLAAQTLHATGFGRLAIPALEQLRKRVKRIVAMGVLWEQSVSFLYHAFPGNRLETAIGSYEVWPALHSGIGMALLARRGDDEIRASFAKSLKGYPGGIGGLLKELGRIRSQGYAYVVTREGHHTLALALNSNPHTAIGISGVLPKKEIPLVLPELARCVAAIDAATHRA